MLKSISNLGTELNKKVQSKITGGIWPRTENECYICNGEWEQDNGPFPSNIPRCTLPYNSPCL